MRVNIPFAFHVGRETLPPGIYIVRNVSNALWINDGNGHTAVVLTNAIQNRAAGVENQIVFNRYANDYFLSEARWNGYSAARGLMKTRFELELASHDVASARLGRSSHALKSFPPVRNRSSLTGSLTLETPGLFSPGVSVLVSDYLFPNF